MSEFRHFQVTQHGDLTVIHLDAAVVLDRDIILEMMDSLVEFIEQNKPAKVLINFERVERFGSEAIGGLVRVRRRIVHYGGRLRLCGLGPLFKEIFVITGLDKVFDIRDSCRETGDL